MDAYWVKMVMFLHLNVECILDYMPQIPSKSIKHISACFTERHIHEAENAIDIEWAQLDGGVPSLFGVKRSAACDNPSVSKVCQSILARW